METASHLRVLENVCEFGFEVREEIGFPVIAIAYGNRIVHHPLHLRIVHRSYKIRDRRSEFPQWLEKSFTFGRRSSVNGDDPDQRYAFG